jgi:tripartite-type tricarboxylate transporter receptor subunit TctC
VTSAQRAAGAPDIPTIAEVALPGFDAATWFALVAPAGTPREIVLRLNAEVTRLVAQPDTQQRFAELGMSVAAGTPDELDAYIKAEIGKWTKVIKDADVRAPE